MPRKFLQRFLPSPDKLKTHKSLGLLGRYLQDPNIWHLNRHSVATATLVGLFVAFIPLPTQMIIAAGMAIILRANLPVSIAIVWITNPITMVPIYYFAYKVGTTLLGIDPQPFEFEPSIDWIKSSWGDTLQPLLFGCLVCGLFFGLIGSRIVKWLWSRSTKQRWLDRKILRKNDTQEK
ncbi:DUF2062 domain-containing protein [bacterium]|nr:DUF2062 domain-containing protein [bacterium]